MRMTESGWCPEGSERLSTIGVSALFFPRCLVRAVSGIRDGESGIWLTLKAAYVARLRVEAVYNEHWAHLGWGSTRPP